MRAGDFSEGERTRDREQLALAAADQTRVLLCDEPTSNADLAADARVHDALLRFDATVVVICHRLQHVGRFEAAAVMSTGRVVEHGAPAALLRDPESQLSRLCARAGLGSASLLNAAGAVDTRALV